MSAWHSTLLLLLQCLAAIHFGRGISNGYVAKCVFDDDIRITCQVALFSAFSFDINGTISYSSSKYCHKSVQADKSSDILIVDRGDCSFEDKVKSAEINGYIALIIVNTENTTFPAGAAEGYISKIPVVTVANTFLEALDDNKQCKMKHIKMSYTAYHKQQNIQAVNAKNQSKGNNFKISSLIYLVLSVLVLTSTIRVPHGGYRVIIVASLFIFFYTLRSGTFRTLSHLTGASEYNHNETDEKIFETLINNVSKDMLDYRLHADTISQFRLSKENYSPDIFLHPPFFVYSSVFLKNIFGASLPMIILFHHMVTALCIPFIIRGLCIESRTPAVVDNWSVLSIVLFMICPIGSFCSQKIWIDNCLMMTVTLAVTAHIHLTNRVYKSKESLYTYSLLSGLVLGGFALNTKITALALVPFVGCYTIYMVTRRAVYLKRTLATAVSDIVGHGVCILLGVVISHAPWVCIYHSITGRFLPTAWPSQSMISSSPFVMSIINKPGYTYFYTLLSISPITLVGMCYIIRYSHSCGIAFSSLINAFNSTKRGRNMAATDIVPVEMLSSFILMAWPLSFLMGVTCLGMAGGGYQTRFLLPILPATSILTGFCTVKSLLDRNILGLTILLLLVFYGAMHTLYYSVLYPPLFADMDYSLVDIVDGILANEYVPPSTKDSFVYAIEYMKHYGLYRD